MSTHKRKNNNSLMKSKRQKTNGETAASSSSSASEPLEQQPILFDSSFGPTVQLLIEMSEYEEKRFLQAHNHIWTSEAFIRKWIEQSDVDDPDRTHRNHLLSETLQPMSVLPTYGIRSTDDSRRLLFDLDHELQFDWRNRQGSIVMKIIKGQWSNQELQLLLKSFATVMNEWFVANKFFSAESSGQLCMTATWGHLNSLNKLCDIRYMKHHINPAYDITVRAFYYRPKANPEEKFQDRRFLEKTFMPSVCCSMLGSIKDDATFKIRFENRLNTNTRFIMYEGEPDMTVCVYSNPNIRFMNMLLSSRNTITKANNVRELWIFTHGSILDETSARKWIDTKLLKPTLDHWPIIQRYISDAEQCLPTVVTHIIADYMTFSKIDYQVHDITDVDGPNLYALLCGLMK
jgi:hypothetical protein